MITQSEGLLDLSQVRLEEKSGASVQFSHSFSYPEQTLLLNG